jgi:hypothetical protein
MNQYVTREGTDLILDEPCGCSDCDHGVQPGHFACEQPSALMLDAERDGLVVRAYEDGAWRWIVATR